MRTLLLVVCLLVSLPAGATEFGPFGAGIRYLFVGDSWARLIAPKVEESINGCPIENVAIGGSDSLLWLNGPIAQALVADAIAASPEPVVVWLTVGLVDRAFNLVPSETVARRGEELARLYRSFGAYRVIHVSYNVPASATNIIPVMVDWFDLIEPQGFWHEVINLHDLDPHIVGDGGWHTNDRGGYQRIAAVHGRSIWLVPCFGP